jgi:hypothetical protein
MVLSAGSARRRNSPGDGCWGSVADFLDHPRCLMFDDHGVDGADDGAAVALGEAVESVDTAERPSAMTRWRSPAVRTTLPAMDTAPLPGDKAHVARPETEADRRRRIAWEAERIAEADASIAAGRLVDEADVNAWIDSLGTDHELPVPYSRR